MKVTAIIDENVIKDAMKYSKASTITETLKVALNEYIRLQKLKKLNESIKKNPIHFEYTAEEIRNINRQ
ncbi:antitoxin of type II TA system, VapB [Tangfeifania diversioriginum]|uniref:Antitoxin of type II TA system, VapB n=1 Tax=Tangfeifania diversioriginum TaxID=1168035 RepID=A0A1M6FF34_9BACT|nr:type II toxin-antitoxin system VapB family antitoxin [Tangfeifania diversioriginum]SHI96330.1 antitoxin of type II TA system, VapB [Tangfeifania diversioriginum]